MYFMWYFKQKHFQSIIWYSVLFSSLRWRDLLLINIQIEKIHLPTILHCDFTSAGERATILYQDRLEIFLTWPSLLSLFCQCMPWEKSLISRDMQLLLISAKWFLIKHLIWRSIWILLRMPSSMNDSFYGWITTLTKRFEHYTVWLKYSYSVWCPDRWNLFGINGNRSRRVIL